MIALERPRDGDQLLQAVRRAASLRRCGSPGTFDAVEERARGLRGRLSDVGLENTDEDRVLWDRFRNDSRYESLPDWPVDVFLDALDAFLEEYAEESTEVQDTLVGESEVRARLCAEVSCGPDRQRRPHRYN